MFGRFSEGLAKGELSHSISYHVCAHQIPSLAPDSLEFFLAHDSKDTVWGAGGGTKLEVQCDDIGRTIAEVVEAEKELVDDLERVVTRSESKYCV